MRIFIYNLIAFPENISLHVKTTFLLDEIEKETQNIFKSSKTLHLFDSSGKILQDLSGAHHGDVYFAYDRKEVPPKFNDYVVQAHRDRVIMLSKKEVTLDIVEMTILGLITFYISWFLTNGGRFGAIPICLYLAYACFRKEPRLLTHVIKSNVRRILLSDRRILYVGLVWYVLKISIEKFLPSSNGTSPMLILFSISMSIFFFIPKVADWLWKAVIKRKVGACYFFHPIKNHPFLAIASLSMLLLTVFLDPYITSYFIGTVGHGDCQLLLAPESTYFQEAKLILNAFPEVLNINQFNILESFLEFATGLGEVPRILPVLIMLAVFTQIIVPQQYELVRHVFFKAVLAQVVGGFISAMLKLTFHRFRPIAYGDPLMFTGPGLKVVDHWSFSKLDLSFPCGHAAVTFATCYVFYQGVFAFIQNNRSTFVPSQFMRFSIGTVIFIFSSLTGLSRVVHCKHWASDVIAGVLLGICVGSWSVGDNFDFIEKNPLLNRNECGFQAANNKEKSQ